MLILGLTGGLVALLMVALWLGLPRLLGPNDAQSDRS
jgi:hypothetical protein